MLKIIENPFYNGTKFPDLADKKYIFKAELGDRKLYAKIGLKPLVGYILYKLGLAKG